MTKLSFRTLVCALLLVLLAATPFDMVAQKKRKASTHTQSTAKPWATYSNGVLTFSYGSKPQPPSQIDCKGCGRKLSFSTNYCSNCGTRNQIEFIVFDVPLANKENEMCPWHTLIYESKIRKVIFVPSFKQVTNITSTAHWFHGGYNNTNVLESIEGLAYLNTSRVTNMESMFEHCEKLTSLDLSGFNTANVTDMYAMFWRCESLTSLNLTSFNTSKVTNMTSMFYGCKKLISLNLSSFNTANVTSMASMFEYCEKLTSLDLSGFNTANVTNMVNMFSGCKSLTSLNLRSFNTSKVTDMFGMFHDCESLTSLNLTSFNTSKVTNMSQMFYGCKKLTSVDLSSFNMANVNELMWLFRECIKLKEVIVSSTGWNLTRAENWRGEYGKGTEAIYEYINKIVKK